MESPDEWRRRFDDAKTRTITLAPRARRGIGMQREKALHAVLKHYAEPDEDFHEVPVGAYIADIYREGRVTEVQTAHMDAMRDKLAAFLPSCPVRIIHPIPAGKWVCWIDPDTGEVVRRNKSPLRGSFYHAFRELYRIRPFLQEPNLSIELLLIDMDEYRLLDGWSRDKKRGSHRYERIPLALRGRLVLACPRDYRQLVPGELVDRPEPFTAARFAEAAGLGKASFKKAGASNVLLVLTELGILKRVGKEGRAYLYEVVET